MEEIRLPKSLDDRCALEIKECYDNRLNVTGSELELLLPNVWVTNLCAFPSFRIIFANFFMRTTNIGEHTIYNGIYDALRRVYIQRFDGITENLMMRFFGGALAMAIFCLNHHRPELYYSKYCELWQDNGVEDPKICEHISACMVYCILKYENDSRLQRILKDIQWRLKHSQNGINTDTLKMFEDAVAQSIGATEEPCQDEQQPKAEPPLEEKEEETAPAPATKDAYFRNTALVQFREARGLEKWAGLVKEAIQDIADKTLCTSLDNTMLAVMYYFASGWRNRKGIFEKKKPDGKQLVNFFLYHCDFPPPTVCGKSLVNKLNELLKGDKRITETDETEEVRKKIQKIIKENS